MKKQKMLSRILFVRPGMMFQVLNRELATTTTSDYPYASISITNPDAPAVSLAVSSNQKGVLRLSFEDWPFVDPEFEYFKPCHANQILDFFDAHKKQVKLFIINCEKGINRSAAVAAALSKIANDEDSWFFEQYEPNRLVYNTITDVHKQRIGSPPK